MNIPLKFEVMVRLEAAIKFNKSVESKIIAHREISQAHLLSLFSEPANAHREQIDNEIQTVQC